VKTATMNNKFDVPQCRGLQGWIENGTCQQQQHFFGKIIKLSTLFQKRRTQLERMTQIDFRADTLEETSISLNLATWWKSCASMNKYCGQSFVTSPDDDFLDVHR